MRTYFLDTVSTTQGVRAVADMRHRSAAPCSLASNSTKPVEETITPVPAITTGIVRSCFVQCTKHKVRPRSRRSGTKCDCTHSNADDPVLRCACDGGIL